MKRKPLIVHKRQGASGTWWTHQQNEDGTPHLAYYAFPQVLSFIWDGQSPHIQVCPEGYGEPVAYIIEVPPHLAQNPVPAEFQKVCDDFLLHEWQNL